MAKSDGTCLHEPCTCEVEDGYCSETCREDAAMGNHTCRCGHDGCTAPEPGTPPVA